MNLRTALSTYQDADIAAFYLGASLGLWGWTNDVFREEKWILVTNTTLGAMLHRMLVLLTAIGILEFDGEEKFRWNQDFSSASDAPCMGNEENFPWESVFKAGWPFNFDQLTLEKLANYHDIVKG